MVGLDYLPSASTMLNEKERKRLSQASSLVQSLYRESKNKLGFTPDPRIVFIHSEANSTDSLGKTGYYVPEEKKIGIYTTGRHVKDILRSLSHEIVHHAQACRGEFEHANPTNEGYAQADTHLREMEREAYEQGNLIFRDWEDGYKRRQ